LEINNSKDKSSHINLSNNDVSNSVSQLSLDTSNKGDNLLSSPNPKKGKIINKLINP
jgi:hypothetical protein